MAPFTVPRFLTSSYRSDAAWLAFQSVASQSVIATEYTY